MLVVALLAGCKDDEPDFMKKNITAQFDAKFAALLEERGYISNAAEITPADVKDIKKIDVSGTYELPGNLTSLSGIEYFSALDTLSCSNNQFTSLDVSKNTLLTVLSCSNNQLTFLDISKNTALTYLNCGSNQFAALDVSKNTALTYLYCFENQLTALDISKNTALKVLFCSVNQLIALNVSNNTALTDLFCLGNQLTSLDISNNTALTFLNCSFNPGNGTVFPVTAWFDNNNVPINFIKDSWYNGNTITIDYRIN